MSIWFFLVVVWGISGAVMLAACTRKIRSFGWEAWLVYAMLFLLPFQVFVPGLPHEATVVGFLAVLLLGVGALRGVVGAAILNDALLAPIVFLVIAMLCTTLAADRGTIALESFHYGVWTMVPFFAVALNLRTRVQVRRAAEALLAGGAAVSVFGLSILATNGAVLRGIEQLGLTFALYYAPEPPMIGSTELYWFNRLYDPSKVNFGTFRNVDYFASFLTAPVLLSLSRLLHGGSRQRLTFGLVLVLTSTSLLLTQGRGAALGCLVAIGTVLSCWFVGQAQQNRSFRVAIVWAIVVLIAICLLVLDLDTLLRPIQVVPLLEHAYSGVDLSVSLDRRIYIWSEGWRVFLLRPWLGWGYEFGRFFVTTEYGQAHNWYLETVVKWGLAGLAAFLALIFLGLKRCLSCYFSSARDFDRTLERALALAAGGYLVSFLIDGLFNDPTRSIRNVMLFWSVFGLVAAAQRSVGPRVATVEPGRVSPNGTALAVLLIFGVSTALAIVRSEHLLFIALVPIALLVVGLSLVGLSVPRPGRWRLEQESADQ